MPYGLPAVAGLMLFTGCAAITNPVANSIPARLVPPELLAEDRSELENIPYTWLRRKPEDEYRLDTGDVLGIYIDGVLGEPDQLPPIISGEVAERPPSVGFPIPIRLNGTIPLPLVPAVEVRGLTIEEAQDAIVEAYTVTRKILKPDEARILVTLATPRNVQVLVIREDAPGQQFGGGGGFDSFAPIAVRGQGTGTVLEIPAYEADVLDVLTRTGGLPGPTGEDVVVIQRGYSTENEWPRDNNGNYCAPPVEDESAASDAEDAEKTAANGKRPRTVRIPLRLRPGEPPPFDPEDIILQDGDIVTIPASELRVYYTGGILPSREVPLPRDESLRAVEAILRNSGSFLGGGLSRGTGGGGGIGVAAAASGIGLASPSQLTILRRTSDGGQFPINVDLNRAAVDLRENLILQSGDVLVLQETPSQAINRYITQVINLNFLATWLDRQDATGTFTASGP